MRPGPVVCFQYAASAYLVGAGKHSHLGIKAADTDRGFGHYTYRNRMDHIFISPEVFPDAVDKKSFPRVYGRFHYRFQRVRFSDRDGNLREEARRKAKLYFLHIPAGLCDLYADGRDTFTRSRLHFCRDLSDRRWYSVAYYGGDGLDIDGDRYASDSGR